MWERYRQVIVTLAIALLAAVSTYYTTIAGLKIEMAGKAEEGFVTTLDKRISNLETVWPVVSPPRRIFSGCGRMSSPV